METFLRYSKKNRKWHIMQSMCHFPSLFLIPTEFFASGSASTLFFSHLFEERESEWEEKI